MNTKRITFDIFLIAALALPGVAQKQQADRLEDPPWIKEIAPKRIVYSIPGMTRVKVRKDLTYKRVAGIELKMDVYSPPGSARGLIRPAVIFIHGGRIPPNLRTRPKDWGGVRLFWAACRHLRICRRDVQPPLL